MNVDYVAKRSVKQEIEYNNYSKHFVFTIELQQNFISFIFSLLKIERLKVEMKSDKSIAEENDKIEEDDGVLDQRSRQCPYLDTINR